MINLGLKKSLILMMCAILFFGSAMAAEKEGVYVEKYLYEAIPATGDAAKKERVEMEMFHREGNISYHAKISSSISSEEIRIDTDREGQFISGTRQVLAYDKGPPEEERIWREKDKVFMQGNGGGKQKTFNLAEDRGFAVDGSLLLLLRFFPFGGGVTWKIFMVDFTGYGITVEVHNAGAEIITVPAGTFECYRVEVIVGIPVLRPKIVYWLTRDAPHYLVKNMGKRGPFTDAYVTTLISRE